jgi:hypothetical protein
LRCIRLDEAGGIHLGQISLRLNSGITTTHIILKLHHLTGLEPVNQFPLRRGQIWMRRERDNIST